MVKQASVFHQLIFGRGRLVGVRVSKEGQRFLPRSFGGILGSQRMEGNHLTNLGVNGKVICQQRIPSLIEPGGAFGAGEEMNEFALLALGQTPSQSLVLIPPAPTFLVFEVVPVEDEGMGEAEQMQELLLVLAIGTSEEFWVAAYDPRVAWSMI